MSILSLTFFFFCLGILIENKITETKKLNNQLKLSYALKCY